MELDFLYYLQSLHTPLGDAMMLFATRTGDAGILWILLSLGMMMSKKTRICGVSIALSLAAGFLIGNVALKTLIARARPCWIDQSISLLIQNPTDFSFPSGHTLAAFAAATTVYLFYKRVGLFLLAWAALIAFSRLYLFVHYPSDVLGGAALGILIAMMATRTTRSFFRKHLKNPLSP